MRLLLALAFTLMSLIGIGATACSQTSNDIYENEIHGGYPGPGTRSPNRDG